MSSPETQPDPEQNQPKESVEGQAQVPEIVDSGVSEVPDDAWTSTQSGTPVAELRIPAKPAEQPIDREAYQKEMLRRRKRQFRISVILFVLTFLSTTLVGSQFLQLIVLQAILDPNAAETILPALARMFPEAAHPVGSAYGWMWTVTKEGLTYSIPLMAILLCHEMGHYLQAVRHRVPASFPYFIPLPIPPLGTMGAVIFQGRGVADRKQMFDIAVSGPLAGLVVTLPVLYYGITKAHFAEVPATADVMRFGDPLIVRWMVELVLGPTPEGHDTILNGYLFAGWVGVFITALNLMPVGQLDGGHILYTLIGRRAHIIAVTVLLAGVAAMVYSGVYSYALLLVLLLLTGPRHPPTANDNVPLGTTRHIIGWLTMLFLIVGFTPQPIIVSDPAPAQEQQAPDPDRRIDLDEVDPNRLAEDKVKFTDESFCYSSIAPSSRSHSSG